MAKTQNGKFGKSGMAGGEASVKIVRNAKTGRFVTVFGAGSLKGREPRLKKGINLTKPIAEQALSQRTAKRKAG